MKFDNDKLNDLMKKHHITPMQLCFLLKRSKSTISQYRSGETSPGKEVWYDIATFFDKTFDYFIKHDKD